MSIGTSRRWSGHWATPVVPGPARLDVLIPTAGRTVELAVTLAGLAAQDDPPFRVIVSDQSEREAARHDPAIATLLRVLRVQGRDPLLLQHPTRLGLAEHRAFLLDQAEAEHVLYLDDDVWLEPGALARLYEAIVSLDCGLVGYAVQGLSYLEDDRPSERQTFLPWEGRVEPERIRRGTPAFDRWPLHNAANPTHLARDLGLREGEWMPYRIAWVGGCVLYRRSALHQVGGFDFWRDLPPAHSGEDVAAQWRVMEEFGGAGILPSGAVHLETPTTIPVRDVDAFDVVFPAGLRRHPAKSADQESTTKGIRYE